MIPHDLKFDPSASYDLLLASVGYETRARHLLDTGMRARQIVGFEFTYLQDLAYQQNRSAFEAAGAIIVQYADELYRSALWTILDELQPQSIAVDISSMPRWRIADTLLSARTYLAEHPAAYCDFYYSPAEYAEGAASSANSSDVMFSVGPVRPEYAGALRSSSIPIGAILGLGFEENLALGAFELLEPTDAWAFIPTGIDSRYDEQVRRANEYLLSLIPPSRHVTYNVTRPVETFGILESLGYARGVANRLVILPMGPKIFALAALVLGWDESMYRPAIWRVGVSEHQRASDSVPWGPVVGLRIGN